MAIIASVDCLNPEEAARMPLKKNDLYGCKIAITRMIPFLNPMKIGKLVKFAAWIAAGFVGAIAVAAGGVYVVSQKHLQERFQVEVRPVAVPTDSAKIAQGRHIAITRACADCHGADYAGKAVVDDPAVGRLHGPNITRGAGGLPGDFSDVDFVRAIRHGLTRDGRALVLMPSLEYKGMSDEDMGALIAYLKTVPPVDRERGPVSLGPIGRMLVVKGEFKLSGAHVETSRRNRVASSDAGRVRSNDRSRDQGALVLPAYLGTQRDGNALR